MPASDPSAERRDVVRDVGRAAQATALASRTARWGRALPARCAHAADDETVEHDVTDDQDGQTCETPDQRSWRSPGVGGGSVIGAVRPAPSAVYGSVTM